MTKKVIVLINAFFLIAFAGFGQSGTFKFTEDKHDFGVVEEGIQAAYDFEFVNTGTTPIILSDVRASCGCTTPSWTREPIAPGGKGLIKASYNSEGRIGIFNKSITVTSNSTEPTKVLYIKGIVVKKEEKVAVTPAQLKVSPKFTVDKTSYNFGKVERGQKVIYKFNVKNAGKSPLSLSSVQTACSCVTHKLSTEMVLPGKSAILELTYTPSYDGKNSDIVTIFTNDLNTPKTQITLYAEVVESLTTTTPLKEDKGTNPFGK